MSTAQPGNDLRERYLRDDEATRFGNLASSLARASRGAQSPERRATVERVLGEAHSFVSWTTESVTSPSSALLTMRVDLESLLANWQKSSQWDPALAAEVSEKCRRYSDQALALSGLLDG